MTRTFIAVEIDSAIRSRAEELINVLRSAEADVKWVETQNLHITLQFLGEVPEATNRRRVQGRGTRGGPGAGVRSGNRHGRGLSQFQPAQDSVDRGQCGQRTDGRVARVRGLGTGRVGLSRRRSEIPNPLDHRPDAERKKRRRVRPVAQTACRFRRRADAGGKSHRLFQ